MSFKAQWHRDKLKKKAQKGFRGYPAATIAYYGPTNMLASKVVVGIIQEEGAEADLTKWYTETNDIRTDPDTNAAIIKLIKTTGTKSIIAADGIIGCPHEESIDYPEGEKCPVCPFWANRDRFSGETEQ